MFEQMHPHEVCFLGNQALIFWQTFTNLIIGMSYMYIAYRLFLMYDYAKREMEVNKKFLPVLFGSFILFCGFTHFVDIFVIYHAAYWFQTFILVLCALASLGTATAIQMIAHGKLKMVIAAKISDLEPPIQQLEIPFEPPLKNPKK